jgi:hypothetical protein
MNGSFFVQLNDFGGSPVEATDNVFIGPFADFSSAEEEAERINLLPDADEFLARAINLDHTVVDLNTASKATTKADIQKIIFG